MDLLLDICEVIFYCIAYVVFFIFNIVWEFWFFFLILFLIIGIIDLINSFKSKKTTNETFITNTVSRESYNSNDGCSCGGSWSGFQSKTNHTNGVGAMKKKCTKCGKVRPF